MKKILPLILYTITLTSCSFAPINTPTINKYTINMKDTKFIADQKGDKVKTQIAFLPTTANYPYNNTNIYYTTGSYKLNTYSYNIWASAPTKMLNQILIERFNLSNKYIGMSYTQIGNSNINISSNINNILQIINENKTATCKLSLNISINDTATDKLIATKTFNLSQTCKPTIKGMIIATNTMSNIIVNNIYDWTSQVTTNSSTQGKKTN
jgi:ABC-type uncharacterized transport system auxiliary subunit